MLRHQARRLELLAHLLERRSQTWKHSLMAVRRERQRESGVRVQGEEQRGFHAVGTLGPAPHVARRTPPVNANVVVRRAAIHAHSVEISRSARRALGRQRPGAAAGAIH